MLKNQLVIFIFLFQFSVFAKSVKASEIQFGVIGDAGEWNSNSQAILNSIKEMKIVNLVMPGDNLYSGTYEKAWEPWKKENLKFEVVFIGNHNAGYPKEIKYFNMIGEYYSKVYLNGIVQFIGLNSDNKKNVDEQMKFLTTELDKSESSQIFIVYHHPSLTVASHVWTERKEFQEKIRPILKKFRKKITAVIVGHDHIASLMHFDDLPVIISGAGQEPRDEKPVNNTQQGIKVKTEFHFDKAPYWMLQNVENGRSDFQVIRAKDSKVVCRFSITTGQQGQISDCSSQ